MLLGPITFDFFLSPRLCGERPGNDCYFYILVLNLKLTFALLSLWPPAHKLWLPWEQSWILSWLVEGDLLGKLVYTLAGMDR